MNKREADIILLACKKHNLSLTIRKEGEIYLVTFNHKIEFKSFEAAKLITNGLVIESRFKRVNKKTLNKINSDRQPNFSNYPTSKRRDNHGKGWAERHSAMDN